MSKNKPLKIIIAEKPSVSKLINSALKDPSYTYYAVSGHIGRITYKYSEGLPWAKVNLSDLVKEEYKYTYDPKNRALKDLRSIKDGTCIDQLVLALDPDVEGYNIQNTILDYFKSRAITAKDLKVVCLEALSPSNIRTAFKNRTEYDCSRGYPGDLRMRLDFLFGTILTRKASFDFLKKDKKWVTYNTGRVQTPTLQEVITREQQITNFKPELYYDLKIEHPSLKHELSLAKINVNHIKSANTLRVEDLTLRKITKKIVESRTGLNTDDLLKLLAREHMAFKKITPAVTKLLSDMYLKGIITYPRVENNEYNNYKDSLQQYNALYEKQSGLKGIVPQLEPKQKTTDHGPITPLVLPDSSHTDWELKVLHTLYRYAKSIFSGCNTYDVYHYTVTIDQKPYNFTISKARVINYQDGSIYEVQFDPLKFTKETLKINLEEKETKPKSSYTTAALIKEMTRKKLGTKSTKTVIIQNLIDNYYLYYDTNSHLKPTKRGLDLIKYWAEQFKEITKPDLTAEMESCFENLKDQNSVLEIECKYKNLISGSLFKK